MHVHSDTGACVYSCCVARGGQEPQLWSREYHGGTPADTTTGTGDVRSHNTGHGRSVTAACRAMHEQLLPVEPLLPVASAALATVPPPAAAYTPSSTCALEQSVCVQHGGIDYARLAAQTQQAAQLPPLAWLQRCCASTDYRPCTSAGAPCRPFRAALMTIQHLRS